VLDSGCEHLDLLWPIVVRGDGLRWVCVPGVGCCGEVVEGAWWMSGHQGPMKDVGGRDSPRGVVNRAVIRGCPNGVTRHV
jgi:hypothetical protein